MKAKTIITVVLLAFVGASVVYLVIKESDAKSTAPGAPQVPATSENKTKDRKVVAYYFHGNVRCMTCRTIEAYAKEAIDTGFPEALKDDRLEWQVINTDESANEHFVRDFQLVTRSVVIEEIADGKRTRWKNLQQVWELVQNKGAFLTYIQDETRAYLEDTGQ